jgi:hypothetical protein
MEQWKCVRVCFFRSRLWELGDEATGDEDQMPRHFVSLVDSREGTFGKKSLESSDVNPRVSIESVMKDSPLLEKAKYLNQMNKAELCALGRTLGLEFIAEEMTRAEMIKVCIEAREKKGLTNQELVNGITR